MFTNRIEYLAKLKGVKHNYLAKECGVSIQTFSRWANNKTQPDLEKAFILAKILHCKMDDLVEVIENE
ncbi:DNA-binding transcriptional regulator, XRE-family HTH domain [Bacillus sp. OV166]|nr:DNA-binding transcriptional regulator, XRE-family HTH domain [Bacillus sp. OV166]